MKTVWKVATVGALLALTVACCRKAPKEVVDVNAALDEALKSCAPTYASASMQDAQATVNRANDLVANRKCRDAKKEALAGMTKIKDASAQSAAEQERAKAAAEASLASAASAVQAAEAAVNAEVSGAKTANSEIAMLVAKPEGECIGQELKTIGSEIVLTPEGKNNYNGAKASLEEAQKLMQASACNYYKVREAADKAVTMANQAKAEADKDLMRIKADQAAKSAAIEQALQSKPCSYVVKKGDSLWRISAMDKIYGNPFLWPLIWDANRSLIKDHPDLIFPDWTFKINRSFNAEEAKKAEKTARYHKWEPPAPAAPESVTSAPAEAPAPAN